MHKIYLYCFLLLPVIFTWSCNIRPDYNKYNKAIDTSAVYEITDTSKSFYLCELNGKAIMQNNNTGNCKFKLIQDEDGSYFIKVSVNGLFLQTIRNSDSTYSGRFVQFHDTDHQKFNFLVAGKEKFNIISKLCDKELQLNNNAETNMIQFKEISKAHPNIFRLIKWK